MTGKSEAEESAVPLHDRRVGFFLPTQKPHRSGAYRLNTLRTPVESKKELLKKCLKTLTSDTNELFVYHRGLLENYYLV